MATWPSSVYLSLARGPCPCPSSTFPGLGACCTPAPQSGGPASQRKREEYPGRGGTGDKSRLHSEAPRAAMPPTPSNSEVSLLDASAARGFSPRGGSAEAWVPLPRGEWPAPSTPGTCREGTAWGRSYPHLLTHPGVLIRVCAGAQSETCELESGGPCSRQPGVPMGGSREGATEQENMRCRKLSDLTDLGQEVTRRRSDTRAVTEKASKQGGQEGGGRQAARDDLQGPGGRARSVASP